jgi:aldose 1-epimerase
VLSPTELEHTLEVVNRADHDVPVGLGIHPWFHAGPVRVPADSFWPGATPLPDGPSRPVTADEDLRESRVPPPMDRCYTGLTDTVLEVPGIRLEWSGPVTQVVVYSEDPEWVCVEPVTMANDGFGLAARGVDGHGVIVLAPRESTSVTYRFVWT